jgi:hypothetical protein
VSVERARAALRCDAPATELVTGVAWLAADLFAEPPEAARASNAAAAHAALAESLGVDLAFVAALELDAPAAVDALHAVDIAAIWTVEGAFGRVAALLGWMEALCMTAAEPGALASRLDAALHDALVDVRKGLAAGADAVLVADDLAGPAGPLLSPDYAHEALLPCYRRLALEAAEGGAPALFHSDGDIRAIVPALARAGFSGLHIAGVDPLVFSANGSAARAAGLVVVGGIAASALPDSGRDEGERAAAFAHSFGHAIVCDDGGITSAEQVSALDLALTSARDAFRELSAQDSS